MTSHDIAAEGGKQILAAGSIAGAILTWWPLVFAIPGFIYYCVLLIEKFSGKSAKDWFTNAKS